MVSGLWKIMSYEYFARILADDLFFQDRGWYILIKNRDPLATFSGLLKRRLDLHRIGLSIVALQPAFQPLSEHFAIIDKPWRTELRVGLRPEAYRYGDYMRFSGSDLRFRITIEKQVVRPEKLKLIISNLVSAIKRVFWDERLTSDTISTFSRRSYPVLPAWAACNHLILTISSDQELSS